MIKHRQNPVSIYNHNCGVSCEKITGPAADDNVDANGMHRDVHVADIFDEGDDGTRTLNKSSPTADVQQFFEKCPPIKGSNKARRKCSSCLLVFYLPPSYYHSNFTSLRYRKGVGGARQETILVDDCTTLRRHMQAKHKVSSSTC